VPVGESMTMGKANGPDGPAARRNNRLGRRIARAVFSALSLTYLQKCLNLD
jgi:hypothetical protein